MIDFGRFAAVTFDCYGTLIDWENGILDSLGPWARRHRLELDDGEVLAAYGEAETRHQRQRPILPYPEVLRRVHADLARRFGVVPDLAEAQAFATSIGTWPAFDDTADALRYLRRFYRIAVVSNVDRASFAASRPKLGVDLDLVVAADDVGAYKPDRPHFDRAMAILAGLGIGKDGVLHVAQSLYHDIGPARALDLATVWIDRGGGRRGGIIPETDAVPDLTVTSLAELVALHFEEAAAK